MMKFDALTTTSHSHRIWYLTVSPNWREKQLALNTLQFTLIIDEINIATQPHSSPDF